MAAGVLIINADDYGLWPTVNQGILDAWAQQSISDCTVLANAADLDSLLARAGETALPVGIHLNLTFGVPLSNPADIPALVTATGEFMKRQQWNIPLPVEQIRHELQLQVQRVLATGWKPSHLDTHHHVHLYPEIYTVVAELAHQLQLPVRAVNAEMREQLRQEGIRTPEHFSMAFYGEHATVDRLIELTETCPGGTLEIMSHPGHVTPDLPSSYRDQREHEFAALTSPRWHEYLRERAIPLISFHDLS